MFRLLSYPRSGSSWFRYVTECLTGSPTVDNDTKVNSMLKLAGNPGIEKNRKPVLHKYHLSSDLKYRSGNLLLLVRNYREVIPSFVYSFSRPGMSPEQWAKDLKPKQFQSQMNEYNANVALYESWEGPKRMFHYEDMLSDSVRFIRELAIVLGAPTGRTQKLIENREKRRDECLKMKSQPGFLRCNTKGDPKLVDYWSVRMPPEILRWFDKVASKSGVLKRYR